MAKPIAKCGSNMIFQIATIARVADCRDRILAIPVVEIAEIAKFTALIRSLGSRDGFFSDPGDLSYYMRTRP